VSGGGAGQGPAHPSGGSGWLELEVVFGAGDAVAVGLRVQDELRLGCLRDIGVKPLTVGEVQLCGDGAVPLGADHQVQVRRSPRVPAGRLDQLAGGTVVRDLVGRGLDGVDLETAVLAGDHYAAEVSFRHMRGETGVVAVRVGVPGVDLGAGERGPVDVADLTGEDQGRAFLAGPAGQGCPGVEPDLAGQVVRSFYRALGAVLSPGGHLFDGVFYE